MRKLFLLNSKSTKFIRATNLAMNIFAIVMALVFIVAVIMYLLKAKGEL